jgi:uncharacterized protein involved in cysteine biosynthesis
VSGLPEWMSWLIYGLAALTLLSAAVGVILAGLALRVVAEFLRELVDGREESETQEAGR